MHLIFYTTVNGTIVPSGTNYRDIVLHAHDVIAIIYGTPPKSIPIKADFSSVGVP